MCARTSRSTISASAPIVSRCSVKARMRIRRACWSAATARNPASGRPPGSSVRRHPYGQKCIVGTVEFDGDHEETAWQRFLTTGPLGLLPLRPGACSLAWSCRHDYADRLMQMDDKEFIAELDAAIQGRLGRITKMGQRGAFPLVARDAATYVGDRTALIGDAAHVIHPLAGLGANIGFQDAAELAGLLIKAQARPGVDIGGRTLLRQYERRRHMRKINS